MSSGKRASRLLKDKFTVLRFWFPHASLKCFFFFHSFAVFVMDVVSSMGNYISILYHNSVISIKNSKNWVTFCASLQSLNCNFNMQYANERPKQFPINGRREDCIPLTRINWLIAQRYQILPFYGFSRGLICANFDRPIAYSPMACNLKPQENSWLVMQAWSSGILFKQLLCLTFIILLLPLSWNFYEYK